MSNSLNAHGHGRSLPPRWTGPRISTALLTRQQTKHRHHRNVLYLRNLSFNAHIQTIIFPLKTRILASNYHICQHTSSSCADILSFYTHPALGEVDSLHGCWYVLTYLIVSNKNAWYPVPILTGWSRVCYTNNYCYFPMTNRKNSGCFFLNPVHIALHSSPLYNNNAALTLIQICIYIPLYKAHISTHRGITAAASK